MPYIQTRTQGQSARTARPIRAERAPVILPGVYPIEISSKKAKGAGHRSTWKAMYMAAKARGCLSYVVSAIKAWRSEGDRLPIAVSGFSA